MNSLKKLFSRQYYRSIPFWLLLLLTLYSVFGFLVLPKLIKNTISEQVTNNLGWQTTIEQVAFNPFLLTLTINDLNITENEMKAISFSRFHADFELRSITEAAYTFKNIELVDPNFNFSIAKDGITNIQKALNANQKSELAQEEPKNDNATQVPKLLFDNISVLNGSINAKDFTQNTAITHSLDPISFNLRSFSTYVEEGGDYQLNIALGNEQSLQWSGNISIAPLSSQGSFKIEGIHAHKFWPYIEKYSPYQLRQSEVDIQANYALNLINDNVQLTLNNAFVTLSKLEIADVNKAQPFTKIENIKVGPVDFDLQKQSVSIDKIDINNINFDLVRTKEGEIEFLSPLDNFASQTATPESDTQQINEVETSTPFTWSIDDISINNSELLITDNAVKDKASFKVHNINAQLLDLNQSLSNKQAYSLSYQIETSQENTLSGQIVAQPFSLESNIKLSQIPLNIVQPYIAEMSHISINKGELSLQAQTSLALQGDKGLTGSVTGSIDVADFDSRDTLIDRRLVGWDKLSVTPLSINLSPLTIDISKISLQKPYSRLVITEDRKVNFSQLMIENENGDDTASTQTSTPGPKIDIAEISINDGSAYFADLSLRPQFGTSIQKLEGYIKGLSSNNLESADIDLKGRVEEYGKVSIDGKINPLGSELYTDINVNFDKIELTTLTPYSGRYAGYNIDKGKLSLDLNYKIAKGLLDGKNRLILDQFELGDVVDSEESLDLPLKLALALFKDGDGVIDISLPTKGDMNSPDFEIGGLVMKALLNVITKAVASPFSLLANIAGGDEQSLNSVPFELGSSMLKTEQKENLKTLATLLIERPQLILEVRVNVDGEKELQILKQSALNEQLDLLNKNPQQQLKSLEGLFTKLKGDKALKDVKKQLIVLQENKQEVDENILEQQYKQALFDQLVLAQPVTSLQLSELAQQRISNIKYELITVNKVDNKQIFALQPSLTGNAEDSIVNTVFSLNSK